MKTVLIYCKYIVYRMEKAESIFNISVAPRAHQFLALSTHNGHPYFPKSKPNI